MITFYPRDIGMWRRDFDFSIRYVEGRGRPAIANPPDCKRFLDQNKLIAFLKENGVRLDDHEHPLRFDFQDHHYFGPCYQVHQWTVLGWFTEDHR
jgi:hypothetical protein